MWKGKFLDLKFDIKGIPEKIKQKLSRNIKRDKLTPLEFTILEAIFNSKGISGYDLIHYLNKHFAGTWKAHSGTIYPLLSKLKRDGFLVSRQVKSPIGPLRTLYYLTESSEELLKHKVNNNFLDQLKFIENFLTELSNIYIHSFPANKQEEQIVAVQDLLRNILENVVRTIPSTVAFKKVCPDCKAAIDRDDAAYCPFCGGSLLPKTSD